MPLTVSDPQIVGPQIVGVARIVQLALTPIFLLSGIAALLNVFAGRLARVADQVDQLSRDLEGNDDEGHAHLKLQLADLRRRSHLLDIAVLAGAAGGVATGLAVMTLFVGALIRAGGQVLLISFGFGVACTIVAMGAYLAEALLAGRGVRREMRRAEETRRPRKLLPHLWWGGPPSG